ncbi:MAG TPA: alpha-L-arabinofuranosidase C-terminal domain-containing protein, partial [Planctomycetota bacterium]|nr:alpha-L-arabinofuranosidase C-terminal domain-containing protein [Planctomycetota bacterium]
MTLDIDVKRPGETISPLWFGHNLEHTRSCVWQGLSAQLVRNRKFASKPDRTGQALDWYRIGSARNWFWVDMESGSYTRHVDSEDRHRYNELVCQRMESFAAGDVCGIGQKDLPLFAGREYEGCVIAASDRATSLRVCVMSVDGKVVFHDGRYDVAPGDWQRCEFGFTMPVTDEHARLEITFEGPARVTLGAVSLLPADHFHGMRRDVVQLLKQMSVPILRWPGGNFAGDYRWKDGLLPVDQRGPLAAFLEVETLPHSRGTDNHEIGTDEFLALCRELGTEPFITINLAWDGPEGAAAWVEYCNGGADSTWGKRRAERGHAEPWNVKFWSLGNELGYVHMEGPNSPREYAEKAGHCAEAMHAVDPSIRLVMSGYWNHAAWFDEALPALAPQVDCFAHHWYTRQPKHYTGEEGEREYRRVMKRVDENLDDMREFRRHADAVTGPKRVGISFDEWNVWYAWYRRPDVIDGVHAACMLNMFCRSAAEIDMRIGCYFEPVNEGAIVVEPHRAWLTAVGQVFALCRTHQGNRRLDVSATDDEDVDVAASLDENTAEVCVTLANRGPVEDRTVRVRVAGARTPRDAEVVLLSSEDCLPASNFTRSVLDVAADKDGTLAVTLPRHGVARLRFGIGAR